MDEKHSHSFKHSQIIYFWIGLVTFLVLYKCCGNGTAESDMSGTVVPGCSEDGDSVLCESHEAVDLGLSVRWAAYNVGASSPEEYGGYYAWGETEEKSDYSWSTYKWCNGSSTSMTKYCTGSSYGTVDDKSVLDLEDDVAHVKWGGSWRMPTTEEQCELLYNCHWEWSTLNGVNGYRVTGPNGNSIFLPAVGSRSGTSLNFRDLNGYYWSSSLNDNYSSYAFGLYFYSDDFGWDCYYRNIGRCVRPVYGIFNVSVSSTTGGSVSIDGETGLSAQIVIGKDVTVVAVADEGYEFDGWYNGNTKVSAEPIFTFTVSESISLVAKFFNSNGHGYVDLGLPSGIKWATCNVGATKPEDYGGYYAWGETEEKSNYSWSTYKWCDGSYDTQTKYCTDSDYGTVDNKSVLDPEDDVAHVKWGGSWRMPTKAEQDELRNECTWEWTTLNGVNGYRVTGSNGNSIFLPAAGYRYGSNFINRGGYAFYWSGSLYKQCSGRASHLYFYDGYLVWTSQNRYFGYSVRPVSR